MIIHAWCYIFTVCELFYCKNALVYLLENVFTDYKKKKKKKKKNTLVLIPL